MQRAVNQRSQVGVGVGFPSVQKIPRLFLQTMHIFRFVLRGACFFLGAVVAVYSGTIGPGGFIKV